jgi:hypothetical protein
MHGCHDASHCEDFGTLSAHIRAVSRICGNRHASDRAKHNDVIVACACPLPSFLAMPSCGLQGEKRKSCCSDTTRK